MKIALGPILYYWPRDRVLTFYRDVATWPVDIVYVGEVICARRHELRAEDWLNIAESLSASGKEVVISTLALLEAEADLRMLRRLIDQQRFAIEANDMAAVSVAAQAQRPFVIGPHINVYNSATLAGIASCGARRWVAPIETSRELLARMQHARPANLETELFSFGRLPLAFSARCFTARARNRAKDECGYVCLNDPDGLAVRTRENQELLIFNGVQTQSASMQNLLGAATDLTALGVEAMRISPQSTGTDQIVQIFRDYLDGVISWQDAGVRLREACESPFCDGYWHARPGCDAVVEALSR